MVKRVLITGSNGFIGKNLRNRLDLLGYETYGISLESGEKTIKCDITDPDSLKSALNKTRPDYIFHLAAFIGKDASDLKESFRVNLIGSRNLAETIKNKRYIMRLVALSTGEVYCGKTPFREDSKICLKNPYSLSKYEMEKLLLKYKSNYGLPVTILRPSVVYGPNQEPKMFLPSLITSMITKKKFNMTHGKQTRDFIYVEDLIDCMIKVLTSEKTVGEIINVGSGKEYALVEIAETVSKLCGKSGLVSFSLPYREDEQMRYSLNIGKAKRILGWQPHIDIESGLKKTIDWYKLRT